jgi:tryptophan halogenase
MFPSASFQYILYGMDFETQPNQTQRRSEMEAQKVAGTLFQENAMRTQQLCTSMPSNRDLINKIYRYGLQKI